MSGVVGCCSLTSSPPPPSNPKQPFALGEVLSGTYELREEIGFGAMGQVMEAQDLLLNRRVAVKVAWTDEDASRLRKEAQALAAIKHPGLPAVYALNSHRGHEYMVMERIHGMGFDEYLSRTWEAGESIALGRGLELLAAITDALCAVHGAGLVHRDVKPANIMLAPGDRIVLLDFGLFLPQFERGTQDRVVGSPWYMAPEVIRNKVEPGCWHLVDLYALGVLAFEILTGHPPFPSLDVREVVRAHVRAEVPDITQSREDIPASLASLIRELLAKSPLERPQSAEYVLRTLHTIADRLLDGDRKTTFEVLIASPHRAGSRALAAHLRKLMPDIDVRSVTRSDGFFEQTARRLPDVALVGSDFADSHPLELAMFLRGSSESSAIGLLGPLRNEADVPLLDRLGVVRLPAVDDADPGAAVRLVREARRRRL